MKNINKKLAFVILFSFLGILALQISISRIIGSTQSFTLFDFFAPTIGLFLNSIPGAISVMSVKLFDLFFIKQAVDFISFVRLLPLPLAALYMGTQAKKKSLIAVFCMILFIVHPIGKQVWTYSLYWLIPIIASFFPKRLFLKALGSTFTAHAVGSTIFLYSFGLTPKIWLSLIPVVFIERFSFAVGIYASYFILNFSLNYVCKLMKFKNISFLVKKEYLPSKQFLLKYS